MTPHQSAKPSLMTMRYWANRAPKGEALLYHTGLLMNDRQQYPTVNDIANLMWSLADKGLVTLVQHRSGPSDYEYLAVKL